MDYISSPLPQGWKTCLSTPVIRGNTAFWNKTHGLKANMMFDKGNLICIMRHANWELLKCNLLLIIIIALLATKS